MKKVAFITLIISLLLSTPPNVIAASLVTGDPADYVIITPNAWVSALNYYVSKKTEQGYSPRVFGVDDIYANYPGATQSEKILNFIKDAFNIWGISYVLLVGDLSYIPSGPTFYGKIELDNDYALLDGDTDAYEDVYLGRLPAENYAEALDISTKWADYDTHGWGRSEFCLTGGDVGNANNDFANYNWVVQEMIGNATIQLEDVINEMNIGYGLINWSGHGNQGGWYGLNFVYTYQYAYNRTNANRPSFVNALYSCLTGGFSAKASIAKNFIRAPLGGAIGYIGANSVIFADTGALYIWKFYDNIRSQYLEDGYIMPGVAFHDIIAPQALYTYNLLGDPTAKMNLLPLVTDISPPQVSAIQLSKNNIFPGNGTTLSASITDNDAVGIVTAKISLPDVTPLEKKMTYNKSSNRYETTIQFDDTTQVGTYHIQISAKDISQNETTMPCSDLIVLPDEEAPVITRVTITPQPGYQGETITINVSVADNAGFWKIDKWAEVTKPSGEVVSVDIFALSRFEQTQEAGIYNVVIYAKDFSGNQATPYPTSFELLADAESPIIHDFWVSRQMCMPTSIQKITSVDTPGARIILYEKATDNVAKFTALTAWAELTKPNSTVVTVEFFWQGGSWPEAYFKYTSETEQIGNYSIVYYAKDRSGNTVQSGPLSFEVTGNNLPPQIILPAEIVNNTAYVNAEESLSFVVGCADPNGDPVVLRIVSTDLPAGYNFNTTTGGFNWTPNAQQLGTYSIKFGAKDNHVDNVEVYETVTIWVLVPPPPYAPSNLVATAESTSQISLVWQDNADDETGFKIERKTGATGTFVEITSVGQNVTGYSDSGLTADTTYYYRVYAYHEFGNSDYSNEAFATTTVLDTAAPTGTIKINNGAQFTNTNAVTLNLSATDTGSGMGPGAQMQFSNDNSTWSTPEAYATTKSWTLTSGNGIKTVYVKFKDVAGNWSGAYSDTIILDTTLPTGTISINNGAQYTNTASVTLNLSASDTGSGMGPGAQMQFSNNNSTWSAPEAYATTKSWTLTSGNGIKTVYVKFKDAAGNWSGAYSDTIILDATKPTITNISDAPDPFLAKKGQVSKISYTLSDNLSTKLNVSVEIYNSKGTLVRTIGPYTQNSGANSVTWDGKNSSGGFVPNGTYKYRIRAQDLAGNYTDSAYYFVTKK
jgi:hypothetical protein